MRLLLWLLLAVTAPLFGAELTLVVEPRWGGEPLAVPSKEVSTKAGQTVRVTRVAALVSQVVLLQSDGGQVDLRGQYGLIDAESGRLAFTLRNVPAGDYAGLGFVVGLPAEVNHGDPGGWTAGHPLNPLVNGLHWGWQGGYVFFALEGKWTAAGEAGGSRGSGERGFSYHLATDPLGMRVRFSAHFQVEKAVTVALALDVARVVRDVTLQADDSSESTHSAEGDGRAAQLAQAVERAWFWLEAREVAPAVSAPMLVSANRSPTLTTEPWAFRVPAGFPQPQLPVDNPLTVQGVALGERLFFDARLSRNGTQSCTSCHAPARAFSDHVAFSRGAEGQSGTRNAMPLVNLAWSPTYAWDGGRLRVRDQSLAAMTNPLEMHADAAHVVAVLAADPAMTADFATAFGFGAVTVERLGLALEQYLLTQVSAESKFDRALRGAEPLSEQEKEGFALFMTEYDPVRGRRGADCFHCHGGALFSDFGLKSNGLDLVSADGGRAIATGREEDRGKFKTPSLRNVAVTAPYMHDGRFATLEDVVAHYDHGVKRTAVLDPNLAKHPDTGLGLTDTEQRALVAFLRTLTDKKFEPAAQTLSAAAGRRHSSPSQ